MNTAINQEQQDLHAQVAQARGRIAGLEEKLRVVDSDLESLSVQGQQYQLLSDICESLDKLTSLGADHLFWEGQLAAHDAAAHVSRVRGIASEFQKKISGIEQNREALRESIQEELAKIGLLNEAIAEQQEQEERRKNEFVVEREITPLPYRPMVMPWTKKGEDEKRFRKLLLLALLYAAWLALLIPLWELPAPEKMQVVEIPERLVKLAKREQPKPIQKQVEKKLEKKEEEKKQEKTPEEKVAKKETPRPTVAQPVVGATSSTKQARAKAEASGVLAFKNSFADLMEDAPLNKLGADVRISNSGQQAAGGGSSHAQRSLVVAQAQGGSGGINTSALSRNLGSGGGTGGGTGGGSGGGKIGGVQFARVTSSIGTDMKEADRPLSNGPGPSRTDEEIQIVFDRYKAAIYRIYNRELRNDPTLQGKMVLRITIEPDGQVSACKVESTDLASPALVAEVIERVKKINFGAKEGVSRVSILYPIDFLPANL